MHKRVKYPMKLGYESQEDVRKLWVSEAGVNGDRK